MRESTLNLNSASSGGAAYIASGTAFVSDCMLNYNKVDSFGAGKS